MKRTCLAVLAVSLTVCMVILAAGTGQAATTTSNVEGSLLLKSAINTQDTGTKIEAIATDITSDSIVERNTFAETFHSAATSPFALTKPEVTKTAIDLSANANKASTGDSENSIVLYSARSSLGGETASGMVTNKIEVIHVAKKTGDTSEMTMSVAKASPGLIKAAVPSESVSGLQGLGLQSSVNASGLPAPMGIKLGSYTSHMPTCQFPTQTSSANLGT